jgi:DNA-binding MarR family transcriptional regulator
MAESTASPTSSTIKPPVSLRSALGAVRTPARWRVMAVLAQGGGYMVKELAAAARISPNAMSRLLTTMENAGLVECSKRLYHLSSKFSQPAPGQVDFGYFVARFDVKA